MPYIISPYREIEMRQKARVSGHVKIKKVDREGRTTFESDFDNLILDKFLKHGFFNSSSYAMSGVFLAVGTGVQTTPAPSDTALGNYLDSAPVVDATTAWDNHDFLTDNPTIVLGPDYTQDYRQKILKAEFDYSQAVGDLTELGLLTGIGSSYPGSSSLQARYMTRALIRDNSGNPVTLTKSGAEKLIIEYELRFYRWPEMTFDATINNQDLRFKFLSIRRNTLDVDHSDVSIINSLPARGDQNNYLIDSLAYGDSNSDQNYDSRYWVELGIKNNHLINNTGGWLWHKSDAELQYSDETATDYYDGFNDIGNNIFTFSQRIEPDTVDRSLNGIYLDFQGTAAAPKPASYVLKSPTNDLNVGFLITTDPVTNLLKDFTLPAGYRLDIQYSFERTR